MIKMKTQLDNIYKKYNRKKYVSPDPLQFLYDYSDVRDREIVALIASSLAYGRVAQILKSVEKVLTEMGPSPYEFLAETKGRKLEKTFAGFKHRFTTGEDMVFMLSGIRSAVKEYGSLNECFVSGISRRDENVLPALQKFVDEVGAGGKYLLPSPSRGSACKRLNLFLRWMVRKDAVDPGGWKGVPKSKLIVPLDTHMARIGQMFNFTERKAADMKMALEITESFAAFVPADPVKFDFSLTRFGIREELGMPGLLEQIS
jgi:uncharacterized protein (TIGR02757 family)